MVADKRKQECFPQTNQTSTCVPPCSQAQVLSPSPAASPRGWQRLSWIAQAEEPVNGALSSTIHQGRGVWERCLPMHRSGAAGRRQRRHSPAGIWPAPSRRCGSASCILPCCYLLTATDVDITKSYRQTDRRGAVLQGRYCGPYSSGKRL